MHIWLITIGEPLPLEGSNDRLLRTGMLAKELDGRGHTVTWWSSTFDHFRKRYHVDTATDVTLFKQSTLRLLHAPAYSRNVSFKRVAHHRALASAWVAAVQNLPTPDVILCSFPTLEFSEAAGRYGREHGVRIVLDIRDPWPDMMLDLAPRGGRALARVFLWPWYAQARRACSMASGLTGTTRELVDWGLKLAGRPAGEFDREFPLGYGETPPSPEEQTAAGTLWDARGIPRKDGGLVACYFGAVGRHAELETVLRAARQLEDTNAGIRFVICGTGDALNRYRAMSRDLESVSFPGWVGAAEIWSLMRRSTAGLAPYRSTSGFMMGIPNKSIEYMSAGLVVVSSLQGALQRLLEANDCGITYPNGSVEALVSALTSLKEQPGQARRLSQNAARLYRERFTATRVYGEMATYLEQIARRLEAPELPSRPAPV